MTRRARSLAILALACLLITLADVAWDTAFRPRGTGFATMVRVRRFHCATVLENY